MAVAPAIRQTVLLQPPTGLVQATLSAGVCTDAERILGLTGDGLPIGSGFGVFPAVTNLLANTNGDVNVSGLTDHSSTTTAIATSPGFKFNSRAFQVVSSNATANEGPSQAFTGAGSTQYTVQGWAWLLSGAATVRSVLFDTVAGKQGSAGVVLTAVPQLISVTATTGVAAVSEAAYMETTVQQAGTWAFGGWSVAAQPVAVPYAANGGTRVAGRVQLPVNGLFTATQGAVAGCVVPSYASTATPTNPRLFDWSTDASNQLLGLMATGSGTFDVTDGEPQSAGSATAFSANVAGVLVGTWAAALLQSSNRNAAFGTHARNVIDVITATTIDLANAAAGNRSLFGQLRWLLTFKGVLVQADVTLMNAWGATVPSLTQIAQLSPGSKPTCLVNCKTADAMLLPGYWQ